jgi:hypothetical protein
MEPVVMIVLCLNDSPIGIYTTDEKADQAAANFAEELKKHNITNLCCFHKHRFEVDAEAI